MQTKILYRLVGTTLILVVLFSVSCSGSAPQPAPSPQTTTTTAASPSGQKPKVLKWDAPPPMTIDPNKKYTAVMETAKGNLVIELFAKDVPNTVNNFVFLANQGYYDNTTFHRVITGFMAQGGDPTGTGSGGPGYRFADEFTAHKHTAGALSMANAGANTNGSQFFITYTPQPGLDGRHTVFGQLVEGMDVLKNITPRDPSQNPPFAGDKIISVTIKVS